MLTPSVNVVQSAFAEHLQGEISGLSRCISNLGSSLGTAVGGTILVSSLTKSSYAAAMIVLGLIGFVGLGAAMLLPLSVFGTDSRHDQRADFLDGVVDSGWCRASWWCRRWSPAAEPEESP